MLVQLGRSHDRIRNRHVSKIRGPVMVLFVRLPFDDDGPLMSGHLSASLRASLSVRRIKLPKV
jgi:hypothetical protein